MRAASVTSKSRPHANVTGAPAGIGCELAKLCAESGRGAKMRGDGGWKNELQTALAAVTPSGVLAEQYRKMADPKSGEKS